MGKAYIVDKMDSSVTTRLEYIGWGTGAGTAAVADTTLFTESAEARTLGTLSQPAADTLRLVGTIVATGARTITNAGSFTASAAGVLGVHGDFTGIVLATNDQIQFTIDTQIT